MLRGIRSARVRQLAVVGVLAVPFAVFFAPTLIAGNAPGGFDLNYQSSPWRDEPVRPLEPQSRVQIDQAEQLPWVDAAWDSLRDGRIPQWSPAVGGGTSLGTNPVFATYSVFTIVGQIVGGLTGDAVGLAVRVLLAVAVGELFAYCFLRRLGLGVGASLFGTVAYVFSGAVVAFETRNAIPLLLPMMLWCTDRLAARASPRRIAAVAGCVLVLWLEGFPAMMVHVLAVSGAWWVVRTAATAGRRLRDREVARAWLRAAGAYTCSLVLGGVLSAFSLVPFALQLDYNDVFAARTDAPAALGHASIWWLLDERALGAPDLGPWYTGLNPIEGLAAVGTLVMLLAFVGAVVGAARRRSATEDTARNFWAVTVAVLVVATYAGGPLLDLFESLPGFSGNPFSRIRFVAVFGLVVLAAMGFERVERWWAARRDAPDAPDAANPTLGSRLRRRWPHVAVAIVFVLGVTAPFVTSLGEFVDVTRAATGPAVGSWRSELGLLVVALVVGVVAVRLTRRLEGPWAAWRTIGLGAFAAAIAFGQVGLQITRLTPQVDRAFYAPSTTGYSALRSATGSTWRFIGSGMGTFAPNSAMTNGVVDARSHSFRDPEWKALVLAVFPNALAADPLKINADLHRDVVWGSPVFDDMSIGVLALSSSEVPLGDRGVVPAATSWTEIGNTGSFRWIGPSVAYVGLDLRLRPEGDCSQGDVTVTATREGSAPVVSRRPLGDARKAAAKDESLPFAVPMDHDGDVPATVEVGMQGAPGGCRLAVGLIGDDAASAPITRPADATWRLESAVGGWLYTRASAHPLVRLVSDWAPHRTRAGALTAATDPDRRSDDPLPVAHADAPTSATTGGDVVDWSADDHGISIRTTAQGSSMVVASFNAAPGWSVEVDGREAEVVEPDGALLGVAVPAGSHRVRFEYRQPGLRLGILISVLGGMCLLALIVAPWWRRRVHADKTLVRGFEGAK